MWYRHLELILNNRNKNRHWMKTLVEGNFILHLLMNPILVCYDLGISDGPSVTALTSGFDTPEERYQKLKKASGYPQKSFSLTCGSCCWIMKGWNHLTYTFVFSKWGVSSQHQPQNNILVMFKLAKVIICWKKFWVRAIISKINLICRK